MTGKLKLLLPLFFLAAGLKLFGAQFENFSYADKDIVVSADDNRLFVKNSKMERVWFLTDFGLATQSITNLESGKVWQNKNTNEVCDWQYKGLIDGKQKAKLIKLAAYQNDDEGFTDEHTEIVAEFEYPEAKSFIEYRVWIYPDTMGIRTQAFIKGDLQSTSFGAKEKSAAHKASLRLAKGKNASAKNDSPKLPKWQATYTADKKSVEYQALNLESSKNYKLGISWIDAEGFKRKQRVRITSVDRESSFVVIEPQNLPDFKDAQSPAAEFVVNIPKAVLIDGTCRIYIDNQSKAKNACVSEVWLYESDAKQSEGLEGDEDRIKQLEAAAPKGYALAAYVDCGTQNANETLSVRGRVDFMPVDATNLKRIYAGYYNDTQNRNKPSTPILKEEVKNDAIAQQEENWWASMLAIEDNKDGIIILKESHKCVNQYGVETGNFIVNKNGVYNTGTSLLPEEIEADKYKWFWGSWIIPYESGDDTRELTLKRFDRKRFPVNVERDMYALVCTWGHSKNQRDGRNYAVESEILKEMDYVKEIGADLLLIDDGWQVSLKAKSATPDETQHWRPAPSNYPEGWKNVKAKAAKLNLELGLWGVAQEMPAEDMIWNWEQIHMRQLKLDFAHFGTHEKLSTMMDTVRRFMKSVDRRCIISWDLTENAARYGYYWAREYGNLHFVNRKPVTPPSVLYVPHLALRDYWQLARYNNLNKYQLTIQHAKATVKPSDASEHPEIYCVATGLMGVPEFMAMPRYYQPEDRKHIAELMEIYKSVRKDIFTGYVFPIGDEPNNKNWSGFQSVNENDSTKGFLTIFRELRNTEGSRKISLRFVEAGKKIKLTNLRTGKSETQILDTDKAIALNIKEPADFLFLKWEIIP